MLYVILAMMVLCDNGMHISLGTWLVAVLLTLWTITLNFLQWLTDQQKGGDES